MSSLFVVLVLSSTALAAEVRIREVPLAVYTKDGGTIDDLAAEEVEIKEDGRKRTVLGVTRDVRPLDVALILDTSQWMGDDYRTTLVPAAMELWHALPPQARLTIWTCGGRVSRPVDFGVEAEAAETTLQKMVTGGPNFGLQAVIDASLHLQQEGAERRVLMFATTSSIMGSKNLIDHAYQVIPDALVTPVVVLVGKSGTGAGVTVGGEGRNWDVESVLEHMFVGYGGNYELVLTTQAIGKMLTRAATAISSEFLVRFESEADTLKRPEVKLKRKDARILRSGLARLAR